MSAAAARRCTRSASAIIRRQVTGFHNLTIDGCTASRKTPILQSAASRPFEAAGHRWRIRYFPNGSWWRSGYMSLFLELHEDHGDGGGGDGNDDPVEFTFTVLDPAGNPQSRRGGSGIVRGQSKELLHVDMRASAVKNWTESGGAGNDNAKAAAPAAASRVVVPPSDLRDHLVNLLWKKEGKDVTFAVAAVGGEPAAYEYDAHGWLLAARSPVFEAELLAAANEKAPGGGVRRRVEVQGIEPHVFHAMLQFMYTDALPRAVAEGPMSMAWGLLAAAHRYELERLKLMCEEMLCERVRVETVAGSLAVADGHGCRALKDACMEFIARPGVLKAGMETEGFQKMKANCPNVMLELVMKKLAA
ncbi:hypothetical protein EJB05_01143, partial [Eragrostis curvula]